MNRRVLFYICFALLITLPACDVIQSLLTPVPTERYKNLTYKILIDKPKKWLTIDQYQNSRLLRQLQEQLGGMGGTVICAFTNETNPSYPPSISIALVEQRVDPAKIKDFVQTMDKSLSSNPDVIERPRIVHVAGQKAVKLVVNMYSPAIQQTVITETYIFFRENGMFILGATAPFEKYDSFKFLFRKIISSIEFF